ncbi:uncharacterized protein CDAR_553151 [Caerostris darwini]|uniref:Uncharacterized protein n=1 Tax=Caerostris darwini TaxID=1538125 RepID=A0AAV4X3E0_9ARAC|nr:uncharacterized protein CDAR_553151 [Caerostris darwini]
MLPDIYLPSHPSILLPLQRQLNVSNTQAILDILVNRCMGSGNTKNMKYMTRAVNLLRDAASMTEKATRMDKYMKGVDWMWVRSVTHVKHPYENIMDTSADIPSTFDADNRHCPSCKAEIKIEPTDEEIRGLEEDSRLRVLKSFENSIWNQHSRYGILRRTLRHLNTSIENTIDKPGKYLMVEDISHFFIVGKFTEFMNSAPPHTATKLSSYPPHLSVLLTYLILLDALVNDSNCDSFGKWTHSTTDSMKWCVVNHMYTIYASFFH